MVIKINHLKLFYWGTIGETNFAKMPVFGLVSGCFDRFWPLFGPKTRPF
jgi:hypothetical protein